MKNKQGIEVKLGQVWRDLDKRMYGRTCEVIGFDGDKVILQGVRKTRVSIDRLHYRHNGWEFVK